MDDNDLDDSPIPLSAIQHAVYCLRQAALIYIGRLWEENLFTADLVEFHKTDTGETPYPVEYKRGKPKLRRADEAQLCAQALCKFVLEISASRTMALCC